MPTPSELAAARYETSTTLRNLAVAAAVNAWLQQDSNTLAQNFTSGLLLLLRGIISGARRKVVDDADDYVLQSLKAQGLDVVQAAQINPAGFDTDEASDGRNLDGLLFEVVIDTKMRIARGTPPKQAVQESSLILKRIVSTQIMDASRMSDQVAIVTIEPSKTAEIPSTRPKLDAGYAGSENPIPPKELELLEPTRKAAKLDKFGNPMGGRFGYVRMLNPPSCGRCALLAGRWYGWNAGFKRHPECDCIHIPCLVANPEVSEMITDPMAYFESLSREDQNKYFGVAASKAINDGADIFQIVNATTRKGAVYTAGGKKYTSEGVTRRGIYGGRNGAGRNVRGGRLTPEQIYRDADGDRIEALRLLHRYGYVVS